MGWRGVLTPYPFYQMKLAKLSGLELSRWAAGSTGRHMESIREIFDASVGPECEGADAARWGEQKYSHKSTSFKYKFIKGRWYIKYRK